MNVAILVGRFGPGTGTGGVGYRLAGWLRDRGHRVEVWTGHADVPLDGVPTHPLGSRWTAASRVPEGFVRLALDRVPGCEVARASGGVHRAWLAVRGRWSPADLVEAALDARTARTSGVVICNSLRAAGEVMAWHRVPAARIRVVPTAVAPAPVDPALRAAVRAGWGVPAGGRVALFVGHGFRRKNLPVAVAAFRGCAAPADRLVVAGSDAHAERWLAPARAALGERLVRAAPSTAIGDWLAGADALLHPTLYDAASNTVLEAMAAGVAPIVSARDGAAERVPDRRLVVGDPTRVGCFTRALRYAWGSPEVGRRCAVAVEGWPESRMADTVEDILRETTNG
ncbi:MAG: glycosyltransferase family 4 protein [Myxococcota bacterium]